MLNSALDRRHGYGMYSRGTRKLNCVGTSTSLRRQFLHQSLRMQQYESLEVSRFVSHSRQVRSLTDRNC